MLQRFSTNHIRNHFEPIIDIAPVVLFNHVAHVLTVNLLFMIFDCPDEVEKKPPGSSHPHFSRHGLELHSCTQGNSGINILGRGIFSEGSVELHIASNVLPFKAARGILPAKGI
eukprot:INCI8934.2.p1 GENE.INCI8934.2~~INCI8934.2.p1  ORF type:complete len:114 (+),score=4.39 INCI8934.2:625-966(+)